MRNEDMIMKDQEEVLVEIQNLVQGMQDDYVDTNRLSRLESLVKVLRALETEFEVLQDSELEAEEEMMRREDEAERIRAIEATQY